MQDEYRNSVLQRSSHVDLLRWRAYNQPEQKAYIFLSESDEAETPITYAELDRQARLIAARLQQRYSVGERALLLYPSGLEYMAAFYGCLYAGIIPVPVYPPRSKLHVGRLEAIVRDAQPAVVLTTRSLSTSFRQSFSLVGQLKRLPLEVTDAQADDLADMWREVAVTGETVAFLQYTSGSTGNPKGVMVSHANLLYNHRMIQEALQHPDGAPYVNWLPLFHDMGLIGNALQAVYLGVPCVLMLPNTFLQRPFRWLQAISRFRAYTACAPNFAYDLCARRITQEQRASLDLSCWKNAVNGAEPIRSETLERFVDAFASCGFRREAFRMCYGLAEATALVSCARPETPPVIRSIQMEAFEQDRVVLAPIDDDRARKAVGSGQTCLDQKIAIVDPQSLTRCGAGQIGEIWVSGSNVPQGYWNRAEETQQTFQAYLADTGEGPFLRTGDAGFLDNEEVFIAGRFKDIIIAYGRNYYPQDIELVAEQSHPALRPNSNAAFSLDVAGEERVILVQEVERQHRHQDMRDVFSAIRQAVLEEYELHVYGIVLIKPGSIPRTSSGKIRRRTCREAFLTQTLSIVSADLPRAVTALLEKSGVRDTPTSISSSAQAEPQPVVCKNTPEIRQSSPAQGDILMDGADVSATMPSEQRDMQFSLLYFASDEAAFAGNKYELLLEGAKFADQHDFTALWIPERHFHPFGGLYPNPSVLAASLAPITRRIRLRAGSVVLPMHHPARVAEEWSVVDNLSSGRVDLAFATGWNPNDFVLAPEKYANRKEVLYSGVEIFRKLWRGESIILPNGLGQQTAIKIYPQPKQQELVPWITCSGNPERFVEAGAMGANVLTGLLFQTREELAEKIKAYREARARHGYDPASGHVTLMLHTFIGEDIDEVRRSVRPPFLRYLESSVDLWKHEMKKLAGLSAQERENVLSYAFERYFQTHALFGTPQTSERMIAYLSAIGVDEIASLIDFGIDTDTVMDGLYWLNSLRKRYQNREHKDKRTSEAIHVEMSRGVPDRISNVQRRYVEENGREWHTTQAHPSSLPHAGRNGEAFAGSALLTRPVATEKTLEDTTGVSTEQDQSFLHRLLSTTPAQRQGLLQSYLWQQVAQALERSVQELAGIPDLRSLGLDSLMVMSILNNCQRDLQITLDAGQFYERPSLESLAFYVAEELQRVHTQDVAEKQTREMGLALQRLERQTSFPLSFAQQRLWFLCQLKPNTIAYNVPTVIRFKGDLNREALERSLTEIVRRHEILRTTFAVREGQPAQIINDKMTLSLPVRKLNDLDSRTREMEIQRLAREEAQRPFDLMNGPLVRTTLLQLDATDYVLLFTYHHIIADGWSRKNLMRELQALYAAYVTGQPSPLEEVPIQYADFAVWQRKWLESPLLNGSKHTQQQNGEAEQTLLTQQLAYWKEQLAGPLPITELPADHPRPPIQTFHGAHQSILLPERIVQGIKELSKREGTTLFMALLASFQILLARYNGQRDILVGTPIAGRNRAEVEPLIGFFANTLVLRTNLSGNPSYQEALQRVRATCLGAYAHQEAPFEEVVKALRPERDLSRHPLFQIMFALEEDSWWFESELAGVHLQQVQMESGLALFDVTCSITSSGLGLVEYNTDLFEESTIAQMIGHWYTLLEAIIADPQQRIEDIPLLTPAERQHILIDWNDTLKAYTHAVGLHQLFEQQVREAPDAVAIMTPTTTLTYREVERRANQLAHALSRMGIKAEVRVGICMERVPEAIIGLLGILKAGGVYVPLDPHYPHERLAFILEDARIAVVLTQKNIALPPSGQDLTLLYLETSWFQETGESVEPLNKDISLDQLAYVIYTSGSTGRPKGVQVSHRGLQNLAEVQTQNFHLQPIDHILQFSSLSFDASIWEICMSLGTGAALCLGTEQILFAGQPLQELIAQQAISVITLPPSILATLPSDELPQLRTIIVAGEDCPSELAERWAVDRYFFNAYGPTEGTVCATMAWCQAGSQRRPSIGHPIARTRVYVLDERLEPVPPGVVGDMYIAGVHLARGYQNQADVTAERFIPHPFSQEPGSRLYKTGDTARYGTDGSLYFAGRKDHQVKVRGFRIELGEIETVLGCYPGIRDAIVLAREDIAGDKRLIAYLTPQDAAMDALDISELRLFLKQQLPDYMVPSTFLIVPHLPLTPNGKVDRQALAELALSQTQPLAELSQPSNDIERTIANIWQEVLHVNSVGIHQNFFDIGGHSLLVVEAVNRLQQALKRDIRALDLFKFTTVASLADYLNQSNGGSLTDDHEQSDMSAELKVGRRRIQEQRRLRLKEI